MERIMILSTTEEIAAGLKIILNEYSENTPKPSFEAEKMTVGEAAKYIDISYPTLCKWINQKKIPVHGVGRTRFLMRSELIEAYKLIK